MSMRPTCGVCDEPVGAYSGATRCHRCDQPCPTCGKDVATCPHPLQGKRSGTYSAAHLREKKARAA